MARQKIKVTIVIPHFSGEEILRRCLAALRATSYSSFNVIVVDNASTDRSIEMVEFDFPEVQVVRSPYNLGYAGGCNLGIRSGRSPYIVLLNDDAVVTPDWLGPLIQIMESSEIIAAVQPKILSLLDRQMFDYCGAAGGEMDVFGYPFARGRVFQTIERDEGQYDRAGAVFWASGAAVMLRRSVLEQVGLFDDYFFAHMEEIDLNWRMQKAGYRIAVEPKSIVYHQTGGTLAQESYRKMQLNQRNNLIMILKNYGIRALCWIVPLRIILDLLTVFAFPVVGFKRAVAAFTGWIAALFSLPVIFKQRKEIKKYSCVPDRDLMKRMYRGSIALAYYLLGIRNFSQINFCETFLPNRNFINKNR